VIKATPNYHFSTSPDGCMRISDSWNIGGCAGGCPGIGRWIIATPGIDLATGICGITAPNNHLTTTPDGRMFLSWTWYMSTDTGGHPAICGWTITASRVSVVIIITTPNNHLATTPDGSVKFPTIRCIIF